MALEIEAVALHIELLVECECLQRTTIGHIHFVGVLIVVYASAGECVLDDLSARFEIVWVLPMIVPLG